MGHELETEFEHPFPELSSARKKALEEQHLLLKKFSGEPDISNIDYRNRVGGVLMQSVRNTITSQGIESGLTPEQANARTKKLEAIGRLEESRLLYRIGKNLQTGVVSNN